MKLRKLIIKLILLTIAIILQIYAL